MNIIVVDDERIILETETLAIKRVIQNATINSFLVASEAIDYATSNKVDIAFIDINMRGITGLELAKTLQNTNAKINIIFCTGYSEYSLDAHEIFCSAYLMKPITDEKIKRAVDNLRHPIAQKEGLVAKCFGNFEIFYEGTPIKFKQKKTKELLAYLIDRNGATVSTKEIITVLYEEDGRDSFIRNLRSDLASTFKNLGIQDAIVKDGNNIGVNPKKITCDYYEYLNGNKNLFKGEYMSQYSFSENTLGWLIRENQ